MTANEAQAERNALDNLITCQLAELTPEERKRILDILTGMTLSKKAHEASSKDGFRQWGLFLYIRKAGNLRMDTGFLI